MSDKPLTPATAAYRLTRVLNAFSQAHGTPRFPIDVRALALEAGTVFGWADRIVDVKAASISKFEGALYSDERKQKWQLLYNDRLQSEGRIRFTQAHELGHYLLHRVDREAFQCTAANMLDWSDDGIEGQADEFSATLLMPLDDFRQQANGSSDIDVLSAAAGRYGTSLTSTILRWLQHTEATAVLIVHRDGFMCWSSSSTPAMHAGAFFRTRSSVIPVPSGSMALDDAIAIDRKGTNVSAQVWFPHAESEMPIREMKVRSDQYDWTMTLLVLPRGATVWAPRAY